MKEPEGIANKIKSYSHSEYNKFEFTDKQKIEERIKNKIDIFIRDFKYQRINLDEVFPKHILDNVNKYKNWIVE